MPKLPIMIYDLVEYALPSRARFHNGKEFVLEDSAAEALKQIKKPKILIKTKATHSGVLINHRVYPGIHMRASTKYWLQDYGKPVLEQHPSMPTILNPIPSEPKIIGRVSQAEYRQLVTDSQFIMDFENPQEAGSSGSGYIFLGCGISDQSSIEEILDGRKITLSIGARPNKQICSICTKDIMDEGPCDHELGKKYDLDTKERSGNFLAYLITGKLKYHHLAFTWSPADTKAQVEAIEVLDSLKDWDYLKGSPTKEQGELLGFRIIDSDSGSFLDMDLVKTVENKKISKDEAETAIVTNHLRDVVLADMDDKEDSMSQPNSDNAPKTEVQVADGKKEKEAEVSSVSLEDKKDVIDTAGYWTYPDPVDGHTHGVQTLDKDGKGKTTNRAGDKFTNHSHEILFGRVLPATLGEGDTAVSSRHPGHYIVDSEGKMKFSIQDNDPADGKPLETTVASTELKKEELEDKKPGLDTAGSMSDSKDHTDSWADPNTQATTVRTLAAQIDRLESENSRLKVEVKEAKDQRDQYKTVADEAQEKNRLLLVDRIVDLEFATGKKNVKAYRTEEVLKGRKDELMKREYASLVDMASDLQKELIVVDSIGTQSSSMEKPVVPVRELVVPSPQDEESKSNDLASQHKRAVLSLLKKETK